MLRGRLPAKLVALLKVRNHRSDDTVRWVDLCSHVDPSQLELRATIRSRWPCYSADDLEGGRMRVYNSRYRDNPRSGPSNPGGGQVIAYK